MWCQIDFNMPMVIYIHTHTHTHIYIYIYVFKKKVNCSRYRPGIAQRMGRGIALLFHDRSTRRGEWSAARPGHTLPLGKTQYPLYRRLGGPQGRSGRAENLVLTGIRYRIVQPVVSHYTNWAIRPTYIYIYIKELSWSTNSQQTGTWPAVAWPPPPPPLFYRPAIFFRHRHLISS